MSHLAFVTINYGRAHSPNPHTNLLNVFIQIANNKGILLKKVVRRDLSLFLVSAFTEWISVTCNS
jgi:hypothetical protein